jgi:hypothetical protein
VRWRGDEVGRKLGHFSEIAPEIDTVFLGSSRVYTHLSPAIFDKATGGAGVSTHSFNLGATGLGPPEADFVFRQLMERRSPKLKRIIVELLPVIPRVVPGFVGTDRSVYWHDLPATWMAIRAAACWIPKRATTVAPLAQRAGFAWDHVSLFTRNMSNLGAADLWVQKRSHPEADSLKLKEELGPDGDGYVPLKVTLHGEEAQKYTAKFAQFCEAQVSEQGEPSLVRHEADQLLIQNWADAAKKAGVELIFYVAPNVDRATPPELTKIVREQGITVWDYDDPKRYPELFLAENRADVPHLNQKGSELLTRYMASDFIAHSNGVTSNAAN